MTPQLTPAQPHRAIDTAPLCAVVLELGRLVERKIHRGTAVNAVTANQAIALLRIFRRPGISRADLARSMQVTPQAVGQLLAQLLDKGLVARTPAIPGGPIEIELTEAGFRVLTSNRPTFAAVDAELLRFFRPNFADGFDRALRHVLDRLEPG